MRFKSEYQIKVENEWNKDWIAIRNKESQVLYWILEVKLGWLVRNNDWSCNAPYPVYKSLAFIPDINHTMKEDFIKVQKEEK